MKVFVGFVSLLFLYLVSVYAQDQRIQVGAVEFYGYEGIDLTPIRARLPIREGTTFLTIEDAKWQFKNAVERVTGYQPEKVPMTCCDSEGNWTVFILLNGRSNKSPRYNPTPVGSARLPPAALALVEKARAALLSAVKSHATDDTSRGYSLSSDPPYARGSARDAGVFGAERILDN